MAQAVPSAYERLVLSRFTHGYTPQLLAEVRAAGGINAWFERQLVPAKIADPRGAAYVQKWFPYYAANPRDAGRVQGSEISSGRQLIAHAVWTKVGTKRHLQETMHSFWTNHFYVPAEGAGISPLFMGDRDRMIRSRALTTFSNLLIGSTEHASMLGYLDAINQYKSARPNENLARELLELHTVGVGNYSERDVKSLSKLLTGYWHHADGVLRYDPNTHVTGAVNILGWKHANTNKDGRAALRSFLYFLANHAKTRTFVCAKLASSFVEDTPSTALVNQMAETWRKTKGNIPAILRTMVRSTAFRASTGKKIKTPAEEVIALFRHTVASATGTTNQNSTLIWMVAQLNQVDGNLYGWVMPNGYGTKSARWANVQRMLWSAYAHVSIPNGTWCHWGNNDGLTYKDRAAYFPSGSTTYADLVDHLSRTICAVPASQSLQEACSVVSGYAAGATVTPSSMTDLGWNWTLATVFDSPEFMKR